MSHHCLFKIAPKDSVEIAKNESHQKRQSSINLKNLNIHVPSKIRFKEKCRYVEYLDKEVTCNLVNAEGLNIYLEETEVDLIDPEDGPSSSSSPSIGKISRTVGTPTYRRMVTELRNSTRRKNDFNKQPIYKGPDVFGKVLGPTADESILVGLQALLDMAGTLEFSGFTPSPSTHGTPVDSSSKESRAVSEPVSHCYLASRQDKTAFSSPEAILDKIKHEVSNEVRKNPCQYIFTQENIAAASKCQHSQTRVLPSSMTCYNPDRTDYLGDKSGFNVPCPKLVVPKPPMKCQFQPFGTPQSFSRQPSATTSHIAPPNCPCSQFYHQMTTISVLENTKDAHNCMPSSPKRTPCELVEQPTIIFPNTVNVSVDAASSAFQEKKSVASEPTKEIISKPIQTSSLPRPNVRSAKVETDSMASRENMSVACDCNLSMAISAGVSKPPSRISNVCKIVSSARVLDHLGTECSYSTYCSHKDNGAEKITPGKVLPAVKNKSCTCSLTPKDVKRADAAISCLKVSTSCQYYRSEITPIESRSTQCGKLDPKIDSCSQICSESGDCQPHRKKSVRILGGPYECPDFSETRYCMEPKNSQSVNPLLDCNDYISKFCFDKPERVGLEMGDSFIPPPMEVRYAITKITKFRDFSTFEVMKSTSKKPKCMPKAVEGVFVLKKEENYCSSKTFE